MNSLNRVIQRSVYIVAAMPLLLVTAWGIAVTAVPSVFSQLDSLPLLLAACIVPAVAVFLIVSHVAVKNLRCRILEPIREYGEILRLSVGGTFRAPSHPLPSELHYLVVLCREIASVQGELNSYREALENQELLRRNLAETNAYLAYFQESEEKYLSFFATIVDAIFMYRIDSCEIFEANDHAISLYGFSHKELRQMTVDTLKAPVERWVPGTHEGAGTGACSGTTIETHRRRDGSVFPVEVGRGVYHWRGKSFGYIICRDISERIAMEQSLVRARDYSLRLFDNFPSLIWRAGADAKCNYFNQTWFDFTGRTLEQEMGDGWAEGVHPDDFQLFQKIYLTAFVNRSPCEVEYRLRHHDGSYHWLLTCGRPFYGIDGVFEGYVGSSTDITDRKRYEEELLESRKEWAETFDTITDSITIHSVDHVILHANRAARDLLNLPERLTPETKCHMHLHNSRIPVEDCPLRVAAATRSPATLFHFNKDLGKHFEIKVLPRFELSGEFAGFIHVAHDISERKRLENELFQSQKMESIGTLAGGVAHDFNNILTVISGNASLMEMKLSAEDPLRRSVAQILDASARAAALTKSLLAFSRKQMSEPRAINLVEIAKGMESFLRRLIGEDIELYVASATDSLRVLGDQVQLEQVILNLAANARDAMPGGGCLTIRVESVLDKESSALLTVCDTGVGISEDDKERIFDPFFTTKEVGRGTGLGLSVVYGIIAQHNGRIEVESSAGHGATFRIYLPLVQEEGVVDPTSLEVPNRGAETILLVEDDTDVREVTKQFLEHYGYRVEVAEDGRDAVTRYSELEGEINLVLMDVVMPGMNGHQAYDAIRQIRGDAKVLFMSGYTADVLTRKSFETGDYELINKPVSPVELAGRIRAMLDASTVILGRGGTFDA